MFDYQVTAKVADAHREHLVAQANAERLARASRSSGTPARKPASVPRRRRRGFVAWLRAGQLAPQV